MWGCFQLYIFLLFGGYCMVNLVSLELIPVIIDETFRVVFLLNVSIFSQSTSSVPVEFFWYAPKSSSSTFKPASLWVRFSPIWETLSSASSSSPKLWLSWLSCLSLSSLSSPLETLFQNQPEKLKACHSWSYRYTFHTTWSRDQCFELIYHAYSCHMRLSCARLNFQPCFDLFLNKIVVKNWERKASCRNIGPADRSTGNWIGPVDRFEISKILTTTFRALISSAFNWQHFHSSMFAFLVLRPVANEYEPTWFTMPFDHPICWFEWWCHWYTDRFRTRDLNIGGSLSRAPTVSLAFIYNNGWANPSFFISKLLPMTVFEGVFLLCNWWSRSQK